ncbi:hypothetical protein TNCT_689041 [Trichonephila clavata]|uniref:Uncharacterized protein n=1 Tax=Trichonephila clavata TaxID=2740835 RepID=A0A8X6LXE9_TRICU|nr:hypothetical protein TNCT_689041 [Trichonephila clavata]
MSEAMSVQINTEAPPLPPPRERVTKKASKSDGFHFIVSRDDIRGRLYDEKASNERKFLTERAMDIGFRSLWGELYILRRFELASARG